MSSKLKRLLRGAAIFAVALSAQFAISGPAFADGPNKTKCEGSGWLCVYDYETRDYGNFSGPNWSWAPYGWDARADWFWNDGASMNACVYEKHGYKGVWLWIPRGATVNSRNFGRSNTWTGAVGC